MFYVDIFCSVLDINNKPVINNLPANPSVKENEALGKSVFQVSVTDADRDTIELYAEFNPSLIDHCLSFFFWSLHCLSVFDDGF
jgi:hypothetical protein